jgi:hypothetical protein
VAAEEQPSVDEFWRRSKSDDIFSKLKIKRKSFDKLKRPSMRQYSLISIVVTVQQFAKEKTLSPTGLHKD